MHNYSCLLLVSFLPWRHFHTQNTYAHKCQFPTSPYSQLTYYYMDGLDARITIVTRLIAFCLSFTIVVLQVSV